LKADPAGRGQSRPHPVEDGIGFERRWVDCETLVDGTAKVVENVAAPLDDILHVELDEQPFGGRVCEQPVHRRQLAKRFLDHGPFLRNFLPPSCGSQPSAICNTLALEVVGPPAFVGDVPPDIAPYGFALKYAF
jgi:hypothetical protein